MEALKHNCSSKIILKTGLLDKSGYEDELNSKIKELNDKIKLLDDRISTLKKLEAQK